MSIRRLTNRELLLYLCGRITPLPEDIITVIFKIMDDLKDQASWQLYNVSDDILMTHRYGGGIYLESTNPGNLSFMTDTSKYLLGDHYLIEESDFYNNLMDSFINSLKDWIPQGHWPSDYRHINVNSEVIEAYKMILNNSTGLVNYQIDNLLPILEMIQYIKQLEELDNLVP